MNYKQITWLFVAFLFGTSSIWNLVAQEDKISLGIKAGLNLANVYNSKAESFDADPKLGFAAGGFLNIPLSAALAIQPEVMYSQKGYSATGLIIGSTYKLSYTFNYLDVPLLLVLRLSPTLNVVVGPQINFLLSSRYKFSQGNISSDVQQEYSKGWRTNTLAGHAGFDFLLGNLVLSPRISLDLQDNNGNGTATNPQFKNFFLQLTAGLRL